MSYAALSSLKDRLQVGTTTDDALLQASLDWADQFIWEQTNHRKFAAYTATRYFGPDNIDWDDSTFTAPIPMVFGPYKRLFLDEDLLSVTAVTNGDGSSIPVDGSGFFYEPFNAAANGEPYQSILLHQAYAWIWTPDSRITITGSWGFSTTPDALIVNTALLLAEWHYRMRSPQNLTSIFDPKTKKARLEGFPDEVLNILESRRRIVR